MELPINITNACDGRIYGNGLSDAGRNKCTHRAYITGSNIGALESDLK